MGLFEDARAIPTGQVFAQFFPASQLRRDGRILATLCIFHDEKTPSLKLYANGFQCFGCGAKGSNIDLLIKANLAATPLEAAKLIAEKFGIKFDERKRTAGDGVTVEQLALAKKLPVKFLKSLKVMNGKFDGKPAVVIVYQTEEGDTAVIRYRIKLKGKNNFRSRSGERQTLYGLQTLKDIREKKWVILVEGESDSWTCWYHNIPCLGVPGKTNWKKEWTDYLKDLDAVFIWEEPDAREFSLKILTDLPQARIIIAPEGLKDISEAHIAGKAIPALIEELKANALRGEQVKPDEELPDWLKQEIVHPALHIERDFATVGVVSKKNAAHIYQIVTEGGVYSASGLNLTMAPMVHPGLAGRWALSGAVPTLAESVGLFISKIKELIGLADDRLYPMLAVWTAGTYLFPLFTAYPYINLTGEKGSGKTKVLDAIEQVAFNALQMVNPTPAVLFRVVHALKPTLLLDEIENLSTEDSREVRQIINAGYKRGATVPRCEGEGHEIRFFDVYSPKVIAAIKPIGEVTEDRAIIVVMTKPEVTDPRQNREIKSTDAVWQTVRNGFYRLPFDYREKLIGTDISPALPAWLRARDRELWSPLLTLSTLIDNESELAIYRDLLSLAKDSAMAKGLTFEAETILTTLETILGSNNGADVHPIDLCEPLQNALNRKHVSPMWVAGRFRQLGFTKSDPPRDEKGVLYNIQRAQIEVIRCRYEYPPDQPTDLHTGVPTLQ